MIPPKEIKTDKRSRRFRDRTGERHALLQVLSLHKKQPEGTSLWLCRCDCGIEKVINGRDIQRGHTLSCGCLGRAALSGSPGANKLAPGEASFRGLFSQYKRSARYRTLAFDLSETQFRDLTQGNCAYCGLPPTREYSAGPSVNGPFIANGVDRWENDVGYTVENSRPCCSDCNMAKGTMTPASWLAWVRRIAEFTLGRDPPLIPETNPERIWSLAA